MSHGAAGAPDVAILLPNLAGGGVEKIRLKLAREFVAKGHTVEFVLLREAGVWLPEARALGPVVELKVDRLRDALLPLARYLRQRRPRALLAGMWPLTSIAVWARGLARTKTRVVVSDHTDYAAHPHYAPPLMRAVLRTALRASYPRAEGRVAVSEGVAGVSAALAGLPVSAIRVIHNPVDQPVPGEPADPAFAPGWMAHKGPRLIAAGSMNAPKNFAMLLEAVARVRERVDARLLILGEGGLRPQLEARRRELGLDDAVEMPGFAKNLDAYFALADLFVFSSSYEGFGNVLIEAMASGLPVVSTDCRSGPREILEDGKFGKLVPVNDPDALAAAIVAALSETHDREALVDRSRFFSVERAADAYLGLLLPEAGR